MSPTIPAEALPAHTTGDQIRVMIVDDSAAIRGLLSRWLSEVPEIVVVSKKFNGSAALRELDQADPDVVILDIEMPEMDGITALPLMLERKPDLVVIMASALTQRNAEISLRALQLGAKDYIPKPEGNHGVTTSIEFRRDLIEKVKVLGRKGKRPGAAPAPRPVRTVQEGKVSGVAPVAAHAEVRAEDIKLRPFSRVRPKVLAIGSSTGGPQALYQMFQHIGPAISQVPVVITQHMPPTFTRILAEQIASVSGRPAAEGIDGEPLVAGHVYVAPGGKHMVVAEGRSGPRISITDDPPVNFCKPAVDPMFESVVRVYGAATLALILTGMGGDGARGGAAVANAGGSVIAQDEATSVVWGMPGVAARMGVCAAVLPLDEVAKKTVSLLRGGAQ